MRRRPSGAYRKLVFRRWKRRGPRRLIMIDFFVEGDDGYRFTPIYRKRAYHRPGKRKMLNTFEQSLYGPSDR
jgi:hypothetical protein